MNEQETVQAILNWLQARIAKWHATANTYDREAKRLMNETEERFDAVRAEELKAAELRIVAACEERVLEAIAAGDWK